MHQAGQSLQFGQFSRSGLFSETRTRYDGGEQGEVCAMAVTQRMQINGHFLAVNPSADTGWHLQLAQASFLPIQASDSVLQTLGMHSAERTISGYFFKDADYASLEADYRLRRTVVCVDWLGNTFSALILDLVPERVNDIIHGYETVRYRCVLKRRPS
jgi:hypothetical protein